MTNEAIDEHPPRHREHLDVLVPRADAALRRGDFASAVTDLQLSLELSPQDVRLLSNLGGALKETGAFEQAETVLLRAVSLDPARLSAWSNLGTVSMELQKYDDAIASFSNALRLRPDHGPALSGLGVTLRRRGLPQAALPFLDAAVGLSPVNPDIRTWRAMAQLAAGDYVRGFAEYEWRRHAGSFATDIPPGPSWRGEPLDGRTLLVHGEGGLGDCLQFARYILLLSQMPCRVVVRMPQPLVRLMSRMPGVVATVSYEEQCPAYDLTCPVMSLPYAFRTSLETVPFADGYLSADPAKVAHWRARLDADVITWRRRVGNRRGQPLKVGLVWAGGKRPWHHENSRIDSRRSIDLAGLEPLARAGDDILFFSLQLGRTPIEPADPPSGLRIIDHTGSIEDFDDTAAFVSTLDLVIAVDTSTAHLAAALRRPVWMLSRYDQCWRWMSGRNDSPWYDSLRIFVQPAPFDWRTPVERVASELAALAKNETKPASEPATGT